MDDLGNIEHSNEISIDNQLTGEDNITNDEGTFD